jgi:hypothetical protein
MAHHGVLWISSGSPFAAFRLIWFKDRSRDGINHGNRLAMLVA